MKTIARFTVFILISALLAGCGFQLRGSAALPAGMDMTHVTGVQPWGSLADDFREALVSHGAEVTHDPTQATATLTVHSNDLEQRLLSVTDTGRVLEYELEQAVVFSVKDKAGQVIVDRQRIVMSRDYLYNNLDILGKEREKREVERSLQKSVVSMAMLRLTAAGR
jgi:LPS-assembly lipoprotein